MRNSQDFSFLFSQNTSSKKLIHKILSKKGGVRKPLMSKQAAGHREVIHCTFCAESRSSEAYSLVDQTDRHATTTKGERQVADIKQKER